MDDTAVEASDAEILVGLWDDAAELALTPDAVVDSNLAIMGGTPVFVGTRVPVDNLFDYLEGGDGLATFLDDFPTVRPVQAVAALKLARGSLKQMARAGRPR